MNELLFAIVMMVGIVGVSVALVQLLHWSEAKRAEVLQRHIIKAYHEGYQKGKEES